MVARSTKSNDKHARWTIYIPRANKVSARRQKRVMQEVLDRGQADVQMIDVSLCKVDLVWQQPVTYDSAARIVRLCREADSEVWANSAVPFPSLLATADPPEAATGDDVEADNAAQPAQASEPATTMRRCRQKTPADDLAGTAPLEPVLPAAVLSLKSEALVAERDLQPHAYTVTWDKVLGRGTYGTVYPGTMLQQPIPEGTGDTAELAIKIFEFEDGDPGFARDYADQEVRRLLALQHPAIVQLLDVEVFNVPHSRLMGLVFERYDSDVAGILKDRILELAGMRHVVRTVLKALAYIHARGLVHTDVKPANILIKVSRELGCKAATASGSSNEPLEFSYQLPVAFKVLRIIF